MGKPNKSLQHLRDASGTLMQGGQPPLALQHTWFRAVRARAWSTLAVVAADDDLSIAQLVHGLGQMAGQEPTARVLVVNASIKECKPGPKRDDEGPSGVDDLGSLLSENVGGHFDFMDFSKLSSEDAHRALALAPQLLDYVSSADNRYTTVIIAVDSPLTQTRAIPVLRAADACIVCAALGRTTFRSLERVVDIVGKDRVLGSITVRPASSPPSTPAAAAPTPAPKDDPEDDADAASSPPP